MSFLGWALTYLLAAVGHAALLIFGINWLYGWPFHRYALKTVRFLVLLTIAGVPITILLLKHSERWDGNWRALPLPVLAYAYLCWAVALIVLPIVFCRQWLRGVPSCRISNDSQVIDIAQRLGSNPVGGGLNGLQGRLPWNQIFQVEFTDLHLRLPNVPPAWDGLSILHVSDLHFCGTPTLPFYEAVMDLCGARPCDILALTGDFVDRDEYCAWIKPVLSRLKWDGAAFAVLGNHDSWYDVPRITQELAALGIERIDGGSKQVEVRGAPLIVTGDERPWLRTSKTRQDAASTSGFRLYLSHTPDNVPSAQALHADLMLAGHNHGGQIRFPLIGSVFVPSRYGRRYDNGLFQVGSTVLHVSRGVGGNHPIRYNCRPNVTRIVLHSAQFDHDAAEAK